MKVALVANGRSGGGSSKSLPLVEKEFSRHGITYDLFPTRYHEHAVEIARDLPLQEYDAVIAVGGDGTNYHILNGLMNNPAGVERPPIGIVPLGRGNSFARDLSIFTIEESVAAIARGQTRVVDVCQFTQGDTCHYFINLMGFGFVTDVARTASHFPWLGDASYIVGVVYRTMFLAFHDLVMDVDGVRIEEKNCFVEFCNSRYTGGTMLIAPQALIDDGFFDIVIVTPLSRMSLLRTFPKIYKGTHGENPSVRFIKSRHAVVHTTPAKGLLPDGEIFGETPFEVKILPGFVRYLC